MILFRADGNEDIGAGHIMRCVSVADAAGRYGQVCRFLLASADLEPVIRRHGHEAVVFGTDYRCMDEDLARTIEIVRRLRPAAIVVDSYSVTRSYLGSLWDAAKAAGTRLVYFDDVQAFPYPCDILINYNIYGPDCGYEAFYAGMQAPEWMLGTKYAPLRDEFQGLAKRNVKRAAQDILISTGGADFEHIAVKLAEAIRSMEPMDEGGRYQFHMIIGAMNKDSARIKKMCSTMHNLVIHENVSRMAALMQSCDLAVSAAGSTLYELCATQTPAITYILADNQILGAESFAKQGILECAGDIRKFGDRAAGELICRAVELAADYGRRKSMAERQGAMVDGQGAFRIVTQILKA